MLKKIEVSELRLGMRLHAFDGPWIDHPFWRTRFVIDDSIDLQKVRASAVRHVWIDVGQGLDVPAPDLPGPQPGAPEYAVPQPPGATVAATATAESTSFQEELQQAAAIVKRGRRAVITMFSKARLGKALDPEQCLPLVEDISRSVHRNPGALC
jgi:Domain of unknown function (DUF3391)